MEYGHDRCAKIVYKKGNLGHKYLGVEESGGIQHQQMKD
jgi:hypothetical protein